MERPPLKMKAIAPSKRRDTSPRLGGDIPEDALDCSVTLAYRYFLISDYFSICKCKYYLLYIY